MSKFSKISGLALLVSCLLMMVEPMYDYSNGLGRQYEWQEDLDTALDEGTKQGKPVIVIIHKGWCPKCERLAKDMRKNREMQDLSKKFIMVNCIDNEEPDDSFYAPDGHYVPRVIYTWGNEEVINCTNVWGHPKFKQYFYNANHIINCMKQILHSIASGGRGGPLPPEPQIDHIR